MVFTFQMLNAKCYRNWPKIDESWPKSACPVYGHKHQDWPITCSQESIFLNEINYFVRYHWLLYLQHFMMKIIVRYQKTIRSHYLSIVHISWVCFLFVDFRVAYYVASKPGKKVGPLYGSFESIHISKSRFQKLNLRPASPLP